MTRAPGGADSPGGPVSAYPGSVRTVEQIVEQIRSFAGADFAFVLTRKGRLVTYRAPRDMPEEGRNRLVRAARPLIGTDRIAETTLPREELVPYGGAAPVDVYVAVVAEQAIICVVMATWADKFRVASAITAGMKLIEPLLKRGLPSVRRTGDVGPAKGSPFVEKRTLPPPSFHPMPDFGPLPPAAGVPQPAPPPPLMKEAPRPSLGTVPGASLPEIHVGEVELGRLSMIAIRHEVDGSASSPEITYGASPLGRESLVAVGRELIGTSSIPEIVVTGEATLGRETLVAIEQEKRPVRTSTPDSIRVELVSMAESELAGGDRARSPQVSRSTVPWVEMPADAKRAADAATLGRNLAAPKVTLKLEEADDDVLEATKTEVSAKPEPRAPQQTLAYEAPQPPPAKVAKR